MRRYLLARAVSAVIIVAVILVVNFVLTRILPGNPVDALVGEFPAPPEYVDKIRRDFGLDQSLGVQLWRYLAHLAQGDLGYSFANRQPVAGLVLRHAGQTLLLMIPALTVASVIAVLLGAAAARRAGTAYDAALTAVSLAGYSVPVFWLAQVLIVVFAVKLQWLPAQGMLSADRGGAGWLTLGRDYLTHLVLPGCAIAVSYMAVVARVTRASLGDALRQDFVLLALAKGLRPPRVFWRHVLPNALIPVITVIGYNFGYALTGAILTETVFGWPGLGYVFITSITKRDYPVLQGIFLLASISVVLANTLTDLAYAAVDPRIAQRYRHAS
jgi:ABC-type dipeptide/oligopeptide/nickel transport system permease component